MALAIDASTPAIAVQTNNTTTTVTTASFTPPSGATLLVRWAWNTNAGVTPSQPTITDNLGSPLTYNLIDWSSRSDSPACNGQSAAWWAKVTSGAAMTITVTAVAAGLQGGAVHVTVLTGAAASPIGAHGKSASTSASSIAQNYTAQATGGWGFIVTSDWDLIGAESAGTGCTLTDGGSANAGSEITYGFARRTSADDSNGATNTLNVTIPGTTTNLHWNHVEILPGASGDQSPQWLPGFATTQAFPRFMVSTPQLGWHLSPYDVGVVSGPVAYQQTFTATLSFTSAYTARTSHVQTATISFTGVKTARTSKTQTATVSFTSAAPIRTGHVQTASVSFTGSRSSTRINKGQTAAVSFTSTANTRTSKLLPSASVNFTGSVTLRTARALVATLSFTGVLTSQAVHFFTQALSATLSFTGARLSLVRTTLAATVGLTGALTRRTARAVLATVGFTGAQSRRVGAHSAANVGFSGSTTQRTSRALAATVGFAGALATLAAHLFTKTLTAVVGLAGALITQRLFTRLLTATMSFTASVARGAGKLHTASLSLVGTQSRRIASRLAATLSLTALWTRVPNVLSALSDLRTRVFGRVGRSFAAGRRGLDRALGRESRNASGRRGVDSVSFERNDGPISGEEDGT